MRTYFSSLLAAVVIAAPAAVQPLTIVPTHRWDFLTDTSSQRGGSTATFTRATISSRINSSRAYETVTSGTAVITLARGNDYRLPSVSDDATGVHIGEAVTFDLLANLTVDTAPWANVNTPVVTANQAADPFGNTTCDRIQDDSAATVEGRSQTLAGVLSPDEVVTASVWVRCDSGHTVSLRLELTGGDTAVVVTDNETCGVGNLIKMVATATNNNTAVDNTDATVYLYPTSMTPADTGTADFCYPQFYQEAFETIREEIQTVGTSAINAESLTYSSVSYPVNGTACVWWWGGYAGGGAALFSWDSTQDARWVIQADGTLDFTNAALADGAKVTSTTTVTSITPTATWSHICAAWIDGSQMNFFINGSEVSYNGGTLDETWSTGGSYGTTFAMGQAPGGSIQGGAILSRAKLWNRTLTSGQIRSVYLREQGKYP